MRYDNLKSAVKKILRGHRREETERFVAFRSHWQFESSCCNPAAGHEKGGVEDEIGYFRRNHLVPVPQVKSLAELNDQLLQACRADGARVIGARAQSVGTLLKAEQRTYCRRQRKTLNWRKSISAEWMAKAACRCARTGTQRHCDRACKRVCVS